MPVLNDLARGRDNNFNLIRMIAATLVLVSHAWIITGGPDMPEPLSQATGYTLGTFSVFVFFAVSGYFITASFDRAPTWRVFASARIRRIYPAMIVVTWLSGLVLGPLVTTLPLKDYLTDAGTWDFVLRNSTVISVRFVLPGVFETNPIPIVAGAIWTLPNEMACYIGVLVLGLAGVIRQRLVLTLVLLAYALAWVAVDQDLVTLPRRLEALRILSLPFVTGMAFYAWRHRIPISAPIVAVLIVAAVLSKGTGAYAPLLVLALSYATFWLALVPAGVLRRYNRLGDYSYGTYLYAYPVQEFMVWRFGEMTPWTNIALALPVTLCLAVLSWKIVEKPTLAGRRKFAQPAIALRN